MLKRAALAMTGPLRGSLSGRFLLAETAGSLGDLGTFIPIAVGMVQIVGLDAGSILVFAGLMNLVTGLVFRIPIAVQPMKAIAALALVGTMGPTEVCVAGITVGVAVLVLAGTGLIDRMSRFVPTVVVRGLQATVAFHLFLAAARFALWVNGKTILRSPWGVDGLLVVAGALLAVVLFRRHLAWVALGLVAAGFVAAGIGGRLFTEAVGVTLWRPTWILSNLSSLRGVWLGGLPQLPLTLLNSVLAVAVLAAKLFPEKEDRTKPAKLAISVGLMNLVSCPFGGMPLCHGSGGLAGQYRFGARSGTSMVILGTAKLLVGLFMGATALAWMHAFPSSILTVFFLMAAAALAGASRFWESRSGIFVVALMIIVDLATGFLFAGFLAGWLGHVIVRQMPRSRAVLKSIFGGPFELKSATSMVEERVENRSCGTGL